MIRPVIVLLILFCTMCVKGQKSEGRTTIGFRGEAARAGYVSYNRQFDASYSAGVQLVHMFKGSRWGIATGFNLVQRDYSFYRSYHNRERFTIFQIPLTMRVKFKWFYLGFGAFAEYLHQIKNDQYGTYTPDNKRPWIGLDLAAGYEHKLTDRFNILAEIRVLAGVWENITARYLRSYGVAVGINYRISQHHRM